MSRNALQLIVATAVLLLSTLTAVAQPAPTSAQKFTIRNAAGETITLTSSSSGVTPYTLTLPSSLPATGSLLYTLNATGSIGGLAPSTNGFILSLVSGAPSWVDISSLLPAFTGWSTLGNALTNPLINFLGTTDAQDLVLKTTSTERLRLLAGGGITMTNGVLSLANTNGTAVETRFYEPEVLLGGSHYSSFKAGTQSANINYTLPTAAPSSNGQVLSSTTGGVMSWTTASSGTVTSVGLTMPTSIFDIANSPITSTGTLAVTFDNQSGNTVFASPANGSSGAPTFRSLVANDIPALSYVSSVALGNLSPLFTTTNAGTALAPSFTFAPVSQAANLVYASPSGGAGNPSFRALTTTDIPALPYVTNFSAGDLAPLFTTSEATTTTTPALSFNLNSQSGNTVFASPANGSSGAPLFRSLVAADVPALPYVSSVGLALPGSVFSVSGSPVTGSGTLTGSFVSQAANTVFAAPDGSAGTPSFRALTGGDITGAALTTTDDANVTLTLGGTPATALLNAASITAGWTGQLSIARGGTGAGTATAALNNLLPTQTGNAGEFLTTDGSGNVSWAPQGSGSNWNLAGNGGTTAGTNFIGTTDAVDFVVKTNNAEALRVDAAGQVGFNTATPEATLDLNGGQIWRPATLNLEAGATHSGGANIRHDNVSIGDRTYFYIQDTASHYGNRITGFTDGVHGKLMRIFNTANTTLTLLVDDANSTAANRIRNPLGDNGNVGISDSGFADLVYDDVTDRWIIHSVSGPTSTAASGFTYFARKTLDQTLTSASEGTNLTNASQMTINIFPDIVHTVDGMLYFTSPNSNVDVQIALDLTGSTAALSKITLLGHSDGGANVVDGSDIIPTNGTASQTINVTGGTEMFVQVSGMFINGPSNGVLQLKIKRAGGASDLVLKAGSYLRLIPVGVN